MEFKGTKGEWELSKVNGELITTEDTNVCRIFAMESKEGQANAKLIAAAHEMLVALQRIYQIENGAFGLKGFDVKRLKEEIKTVLDKALNQ